MRGDVEDSARDVTVDNNSRSRVAESRKGNFSHERGCGEKNGAKREGREDAEFVGRVFVIGVGCGRRKRVGGREVECNVLL